MAESAHDLPQAMRELADNVSLLLKEHIELARAELRQDFYRAASSLVALLVAAVVMSVGYLLLVAAGTFLLAEVMSAPWACLAMAAAHFIAGGLAFAWARSRLRSS
jgi:hypothetical protein